MNTDINFASSVEISQSLRRKKAKTLFDGPTAWTACKRSFVMLRPDIQWKNPVMFVVEIGTILTLLYIIQFARAS